ncbi:hypothetical protein B0H34DRAFT_735383 [Crassisporium funariophilum]|nr:hypothetical protein B0H34DRAFT_735383 [Crassisporium funariophilum]
MVQDSKHALKTLRNNLFAGTRLLVLGNYVAMYSHICNLALEDGSPLFNQSIPHAERVKLVLCAWYFLDAWTASLDVSGYTKAQHHLSREALDTMRIVVEGYFGLLFIHRDYTDEISPFLPWLHSSEACEHTFGESRQIVKDFTMLDFIYMIPKLCIKMRQAILRAQMSDPKVCAFGYNHTYFNNAGLDELALATFPSDSDIDLAAQAAADEADSLLRLLDLRPQQIQSLKQLIPALPTIDSWFRDETYDDEGDKDNKSSSDAQELQRLFDKGEDMSLLQTEAEERKLMNLTDEMTKVQSLYDPAFDLEGEEITTEEYMDVQAATARIHDIVTNDQPSKPLGSNAVVFEELDLDALIEMRRRHETRQAAMGVKTRNPSTTLSKATKQAKLIQRLHLVLKETQEDTTIGTGLERKASWRAPAKGGRASTDIGVSGNSANAIVVATAQATKDAQKRRNFFTDSKVPALEYISTARVTMSRPLVDGDFLFVVVDGIVCVGQVLTMYAKTGGANSKNDIAMAVTSPPNQRKRPYSVFTNFPISLHPIS